MPGHGPKVKWKSQMVPSNSMGFPSRPNENRKPSFSSRSYRTLRLPVLGFLSPTMRLLTNILNLRGLNAAYRSASSTFMPG